MRGPVTICLATLVLSSLEPAILGAQNGAGQQLDAEKATSYLYLVKKTVPNGDGKYFFEYAVDELAPIERLSPLPDLLTISARRDKGLNVLLGYLNPIRFSWTASETTADDPTYQAAEQFVKSALSLFSNLESSASAAGPSSTSAATGGGAYSYMRRQAPAQLAKQPLFAATALLEWSQWLAEKESCFARPSDLQSLKDNLGRADGMIFGTDRKHSDNKELTASEFRDGLLGTLRALLNAESVPALRIALANASESLSVLTSANTTARAALNALSPLSVETWLPDNLCQNFGAYTADVLATFRNQGNGRLGARERIVADMSSLRGKVDTLVKQETDSTSIFFLVMNVSIPAGKTKDVTLVLKERDVTVNDSTLAVKDKGESKLTFRVQELQSLVLEFAPGVALTDLHYPKYGTSGSGSNTIVASAGDDVQHAAAVGMLNVIPNIGHGLSRLIGQVGIGTGKTYPVLLAGGGLRLTGRVQFSLTAGAAWSWAHALTKLKPGDSVTGTAPIESDLSYQIQSPRWYVAAQHSF